MLTDYEKGLTSLENLAKGSSYQSQLAVLADRLRQNIEEESLFGTSEQIRSDRSRIIYSLNPIAVALSTVDFTELCRKGIATSKSNLSPNLPTSPAPPASEKMALFEVLNNHFNMEELRTLSFQLDIDFEQLAGESKEGLVRELILFTNRRGKTAQLVTTIQKLRPHIQYHLG